MGGTYVAVDLGATNVRAAVGDEGGLRARISERTERSRGAEGIPDQIVRLIEGLPGGFKAIGVGSIGPVDLGSGCVVNTPNLPFKRIPVVGPLEEHFDVPVAMLNDCSAAVLGERDYGAGRGLSNVVYVTLSTGLGGGAIVDGHLLVGKDGNAVEIGHLTIEADSPLVCGCGKRGHWEAYCSGSNIPKLARLMLENYRGETSLRVTADGDPKALTAEKIFEAAKEGDPAAKEIVSKIGDVNAIGFADVVNVFDPEVLTVGGSIALNNPELVMKPILSGIDRHLINRKPRIMITPLGEDAVLYGALALARSLTEDR
jgi:glucokinase